MQLSKLNLTVYATLLCWSATCIQASEDTPAQALARKAIMQRMEQEDAASRASSKTPPAAYFTSEKETPAQAAALAALRRRMQEADSQVASTKTSWAAIDRDTPAQAMARAAVLKRMHDEDRAGKSHVQGQKLSAKEAAKARAAAKAQAKKLAAEHAKELKKAKKEAARAKANGQVNYPAQNGGAKPSPSADSGHPATVQARLDALLTKYLADGVSPKEYYRERAAILAAQ